jgi:hypothetical protein
LQTLRPSKTSYVAGAYWFRVEDFGSADAYGLLDPAGGAKPAWRAFQRAAAL